MSKIDITEWQNAFRVRKKKQREFGYNDRNNLMI